MKNKKCVAVGDQESGKTELLIAFTTGELPGEFTPIVFDNYSANILLEGYPPVSIVLWDTAGQEDYKKLRSMSYPQTDVFLICFSLVNQKTLDNVEEIWIDEFKSFGPNVPIILVGLKSNLRDDFKEGDEGEPISTEQGEEVAKRINAISYIECSVLKGKNIAEVFDTAALAVLDPSFLKMINRSDTSGGCCQVF